MADPCPTCGERLRRCPNCRALLHEADIAEDPEFGVEHCLVCGAEL